MGTAPSRCCSKKRKTPGGGDGAREDERTPLNDVERGSSPSGARAGPSGRGGEGAVPPGGDAARGSSPAPSALPADPDPGVFYARPASRSTVDRGSRGSQRGDDRSKRGRSKPRGGPNDTARESSAPDKDKRRRARARKHHHRHNSPVGEERILKFHLENPAQAPLLGSSSEEEEELDEDGNPKATSKNWIGVCPAKLQHRVWWWSVTFVLCFILGAGVALGLTYAFQPDRGGSEDTPRYPAEDGAYAFANEDGSFSVIAPPREGAEDGAKFGGGRSAGGGGVNGGRLSRVRVLPPKAEASPRSNPLDEVSDYGIITVPGVSADDDEAAAANARGTNALDPSPSSSFEGAMGGGGRRGGSGGASVSRAEEDPGVRADLEDAVSRLLRKEIEGVGAPDGGGEPATDSRGRRTRATVAGVGAREEGAGGEAPRGAKRPTVRRRSRAKLRRGGPG